jgi:hypothetical protein
MAAAAAYSQLTPLVPTNWITLYTLSAMMFLRATAPFGAVSRSGFHL